MKSYALSAALLLATLVAGCSSDNATNPPDDEPNGATPAVGSTWTFSRFDADSTGAPMPGTIDTVTVTLAATGLTIEGRSGAMLFTAGADTMPAFRVETNGDLGWLPRFHRVLGTGWITLPITSHTPVTRTLRDTTIDLGGGQTGRNTVVLSITHVGSEPLTLPGESLATERVRVQVVTTSPLTADQNLVETESVTLWYFSKAGYFVREETRRSSQDPFGTTVYPTRVMMLVAYSRK